MICSTVYSERKFCLLFQGIEKCRIKMCSIFWLFLLICNLTVNCQNENQSFETEKEEEKSINNEDLVAHLTDVVDLEGQGLRHIEKHLHEKEFSKNGDYAKDIQAIENGDDAKGIFYFFELHDFDKNNKLDGLEFFTALTDHNEKSKAMSEKVLLEEEVEYLIDNLLEEHDLNYDGYIDFVELMNTGPNSLWNRLGKGQQRR